MSEKLPLVVDAEIELSAEELGILERQYKHEGDVVSVQTKFNYAWGLIKSRRRSDQQLGVKLLTDVFRDVPDRRRECLYYIALGYLRLGEYGEAKRYNDTLLELEPSNEQAQSLSKLIDDKVTKEGLFGLAIVGGAVTIAGAAASLAYILTRRHR